MKKRVIVLGIVLLVVLFLAVIMPSGSSEKDRKSARRSACRNNLRHINVCKEEYAIDHGATNGTQLTWDNLCQYWPDLTNKCFCPSAPSEKRCLSNYTINPVCVDSFCNVVGAKGGHCVTNR